MPSLLLKNTRPVTERALEADILINGDTIALIGENISADCETIDCKGKYASPGLIDMHTHIISSDEPPLFLANGVTSVRNMWGLDMISLWAKQINEGALDGPTVYSTSCLMDGVESWQGALTVRTVDEAEQAVRAEHAKGYNEIKTYPSIPRDAFFRLAEVCRELSIHPVGHGNRFLTPYELSDSGYRSLEHANNLPNDVKALEYLAKKGVWCTPTLSVVRSMYRYLVYGEAIEGCPYYPYINSRERGDWNSIIASMRGLALPPEDEYEERLRTFYRAGGRVLAGTDNTNPGVAAGFSLHDEIADLRYTLGISAREALALATEAPAEYLGLSLKLGCIKAGARADIILLDSDPLCSLDALRRPLLVIHGGRVYTRDALDAMLEKARNTDSADIVFASANELLRPTDRKTR